MFTGGKRTLQACNGGRLCSHAFRDLSLCKPGVVPCLQKLVEEFTFLAFDALDFLPHAGTTKQLRNDLIMSSHL